APNEVRSSRSSVRPSVRNLSARPKSRQEYAIEPNPSRSIHSPIRSPIGRLRVRLLLHSSRARSKSPWRRAFLSQAVELAGASPRASELVVKRHRSLKQYLCGVVLPEIAYDAAKHAQRAGLAKLIACGASDFEALLLNSSRGREFALRAKDRGQCEQ